MDNFKNIERKIKAARSILVATHENPDGDAIGSLLAVSFYLIKIGKKPYVFSVSGAPKVLKFLPGINLIKNALLNGKFDLVFGLDYGALDRLGLNDYFKKHPTPILAFDHHPAGQQNQNFGLINDRYASTAEIVFDYLKAVKFKIDKNIAKNLMTGILTDTGFFKYTSNQRPVKTVLELMGFGVKISEINNALYGHQKIEAVRAAGKIFSRIVYNKKGDFNYSYVLRKDLKGIDVEDVAGVVDKMGNIEKGKFALFLIEELKGTWRGRFCSGADKSFDLNKLAKKLGGGGHKNASGFKMKGRIDQIIKLVAKYSKER